MAFRSPLSPLGWIALLASVAAAVLSIVAMTLPRVPNGPCTLEEAHALPSGRTGRLCEVLTETQPFTETDWLVLRMVVPDLPEPGSQADHADHDWVCRTIGVPAAETGASRPSRIVVQLMSEPFPRGEPAPGITQSIEAYSIRSGACIWELL
ncbi:DUF6497 family protein [Roseibacterium sp. SDUM158016]|jgi:hypothetical protein|uniref:DUF6497 family protein n=1 Tax=Roseicyclus sediminis TaxID=2980997 RepID=UPI0021D0B349|nr:DUF6497 family protein [Roseibacterium sp. SDUM158016]MCU4653108.1 DUF6497 family protein [Roseibacterium sp. SDUM158016]